VKTCGKITNISGNKNTYIARNNFFGHEVCSIYDQNEYYIFSSINCQSKGLNDSKVSQILNSFFLPTVTDVRKLLLSDNQLTHVPGQIYSLYELSSIDLSSNRITLITKGTLFNNSRSIVQNVTLKNNQISYIEPGSLNG
jgi:Leucine-rich repeat (LRR) protein